MRIAINYETTEVSFYRFVCNDTEIKSSYVGHTTNFTERKFGHKIACNYPNDKRHHLKIYQIIRDNSGWDNWRMIEIEKRFVKDKREAERIEQEWIEKLQSDMNSRKSFVEETKKEYKHQYYLDNIEKVKEVQKEYRLENADKLKEIGKKYRLENADKLKEKVNCECGCKITRTLLWRHKKSLKHLKLVESKTDNMVKIIRNTEAEEKEDEMEMKANEASKPESKNDSIV